MAPRDKNPINDHEHVCMSFSSFRSVPFGPTSLSTTVKARGVGVFPPPPPVLAYFFVVAGITRTGIVACLLASIFIQTRALALWSTDDHPQKKKKKTAGLKYASRDSNDGVKTASENDSLVVYLHLPLTNSQTFAVWYIFLSSGIIFCRLVYICHLQQHG